MAKAAIPYSYSYKIKWRNVTIILLWLTLLGWIIGFGSYIPVIRERSSGKCVDYRGDGSIFVDRGRETSTMLSSLVLIHGTWFLGGILAVLHNNNAFTIYYATYMVAGLILGSIYGYIFAPPNACFASHEDLRTWIILANVIYAIPLLGLIAVIFWFAVVGIVWMVQKIPDFFVSKEMVELDVI